MKTILTITLVFFSVVAGYCATPKKTETTKTETREQALASALKIVDQLGLEITTQRQRADEAVQRADEAISSKDALQVAFNNQVQDIAKLQSWGGEGWAKYADAQAQLQDVLAKYHRIKIGLAISLGIVAGIIVLYFTWRLPPPYSFAIPAAITALVGAGTFFGL